MQTLQAMTEQECLQLLGTTQVGRVAVTDHALPAVVPVNFGLSGGDVVFRTRPGGLLARACADAVVAFEVDDLRPDGSGGWSVMVIGQARVLTGSAAVRANQLNLVSAAGDGRDLFVAIPIGRISGRRAGLLDLAGDRYGA